MRKITAFLMMILILVSAACAALSEEAEPVSAAEPVNADGEILFGPAPLVLDTLSRGDMVEILSEENGIALVRAGERTGCMESALLRAQTDEPFASWTGYARYNAKLYADYHLCGPSETLMTNTMIEVIDAVGDCLVVTVGEKTGFARTDDVSRYPFVSGGGGGGGSSGGSADGGDIFLSAGLFGFVKLSEITEQSPSRTGTAEVIADGAELVLHWLEPGEKLYISAQEESWYLADENGQTVRIRRDLVRLDGEEPYTPWVGYTRYNTKCYSSFYLSGPDPISLYTNAAMTIVGELEFCYAVELEQGIRFVDPEFVSRTVLSTGGGGSSGGGGAEWSDPVL